VEVSNSPALRVSEVTKSFDTGAQVVEVLKGISFDLSESDSLAITGPSGSGKSTLLHLIGTLDRPSSGRIEVDGSSPHDLPESELAAFRNRNVGFVFQDHHLLPQYTVLENVLVPALAPGAGDRAEEATKRAQTLLDRVGLGDRIEHRPAQLSGGESQRVAVARALIHRPKLLLCDEPTGNLDQTTAGAVADLLFELQRSEGGILIVVTHSLDLAARFGRHFELRDGQCSEA
jgi:lipoprotein-releasing system ATP-binding protein